MDEAEYKENVARINRTSLPPAPPATAAIEPPARPNSSLHKVDVVHGYSNLAGILMQALDQAQDGKGADRHTDGGKPFDAQPILEIARMLHGIGGHSFQIMKKAQEANRMVERDQKDAAERELHGVIVYAAAAILRIREL